MSASDQAYPAGGPPRPGAGAPGRSPMPGAAAPRPGQAPVRPAPASGAPRPAPNAGRPAPAAGGAPRMAGAATAVRQAPASPGQGRPAGAQQARPASSSTARPAAGAGAPRPVQPRIVRLTLSKIDPFSALKLSFLLAVGIGIATVIASFVVWNVVDKMGVFDKVNELVSNFNAKDSATTFDVYTYVGMGRVVSLATVIAVFNVLLLTALGTLIAALYNVSSSLVGGLKVTLSDE